MTNSVQQNLNAHLVNNVERFDLEIVGGDGSKLIDSQGNSYLDLWGDEGVASLGYSGHVENAMQRFIDSGMPHRLPDIYPNRVRSEAAEMLCTRMGYSKVFFCNSGAETNEAAIKMARRYWAKVRGQPERNVVVTLQGNFHGRTGFALAASDSTDSPYHKDGYGPVAAGFGVITEQEVINGEMPRLNLAPWMDNRIAPRVQWEHVASIHFAPILGNNVVKTYPKAFWDGLRALKEQHGFLVSFDEVQVANGRTGYYSAHQHPNINFRPDLLCIGKGLALGFPAAALLLTGETAKAFDLGVHFSTFGGTIFIMAMIKEMMSYLDTHLPEVKVKENLITNYFKTRKWVKEWDGAGVHWGFTPDWSLSPGLNGPRFCEEVRKHGILMVTHRPFGMIRFTPPLAVTMAELVEVFTRLDAAAEAIGLVKKV